MNYKKVLWKMSKLSLAVMTAMVIPVAGCLADNDNNKDFGTEVENLLRVASSGHPVSAMPSGLRRTLPARSRSPREQLSFSRS